MGAEVTYHDLANEPLLHLSPAHLAAFQGAPVESAALGKISRKAGAISKSSSPRMSW